MPTPNFDAYVICTTPRCGSTLLCKLLAATGIAGVPDSYFHRSSISDWLDYFDLAPEGSKPEREVLGSIFRAAIKKGSCNTGLFGLRMQRGSFDFFTEKLAVFHPELSSDIECFRATFGRILFVHLTRHDKVEQAISNVIAHQTGLWHAAPDGTELERLSPPQQPIYDARLIQLKFDEMTALDHAWESWFQSGEINAYRVSYEALSADPRGCLGSLLEELGLDRSVANGVKPGVIKLADETSREWAKRFRLERNIRIAES